MKSWIFPDTKAFSGSVNSRSHRSTDKFYFSASPDSNYQIFFSIFQALKQRFLFYTIALFLHVHNPLR